MTDNKFEILLYKLNRAHRKYCKLLSLAEDEYKRRFGNFPSEVDDDWWIDSFCQSPAGSTLKDVIIHATRANER
jgi:hypothetical protein